MPFKKERSPYWWISYYDGGKQIRVPSGTTSWREAKTIEQTKRAESAKRKHSEPRFSFDRVMEQYFSDIEGEPHYDRALIASVRLSPYFAGKAIDHITPTEISKYKADRSQTVSDGTIIKEMHTLSKAITHCNQAYGWNLPNVVKGHVPKQPKGRLRWLTRLEAKKLILAAKQSPKAPYLSNFIVLALNTGMRKGELLGLEWNRVDLRKKLVYLDPEHQKSGIHSSVPLNLAAREALKRLRGVHSRWVFTNNKQERLLNVKRSFATACRVAGIEDFTIHDLRHTAAAWLIQEGIPIRTVAEILRHNDIATTMRYAHLAPENTRQAVEMVSFD
jgi:integrase